MKVVLIDDERLALNYLEKMLQGNEELEIVKMYSDPIQAIEEIQQIKPEMVFLDVEMPVMTGIEAAEQILTLLPDVHIVFVTAYEGYAIKAFELNALDYVLKPARRERLQKTLMRIQKEKAEMVKESSPVPYRKICCFRSLHLESSERGTETFRWRTTKAQELFAYLIHRRGQPVRKDVLLDLFWTDVEWKKGYAHLYTTVYQIRKTLDKLGVELKLTNCEDGYLLEMNDVSLDVEDWEKRLRQAPPITKETIQEHLNLVDLYRGDYLAEYDYLWAESERQRLRADWYHHAAQVAKFLVETNELAKAMAVYLRMQQIAPHQEELFFYMMKLYDAVGDREAVEGQYVRLTQMLREEVETTPQEVVQNWYKQWKNNR
ncbi:response regulator [Brevibacillus choshinensis]|uniref:response regulator n=1 Tax=Brevibacillus choshinensis TaxID=54911 RepID=UPI002E247D74|nr:response regulator [Brevibacillus choshinensis]MED4583008.1 response regulator [Brevibacillus choshinensis]